MRGALVIADPVRALHFVHVRYLDLSIEHEEAKERPLRVKEIGQELAELRNLLACLAALDASPTPRR